VDLLRDDLRNIRSTLFELDTRLSRPLGPAGSKYDRYIGSRRRTRPPGGRHKSRHCPKQRELGVFATRLGVSDAFCWEAWDRSLPSKEGSAHGTNSSQGSRHSQASGARTGQDHSHSSVRSKSSAAIEEEEEENCAQASSTKQSRHSSTGSAPKADGTQLPSEGQVKTKFAADGALE
jgi:hypothetical protein